MWLGVLRLRMAQLSPSLPDLDFSFFMCVARSGKENFPSDGIVGA